MFIKIYFLSMELEPTNQTAIEKEELEPPLESFELR